MVAEVGDFRHFANARQLSAYLGLVPSQHSSGSSVRRGSITKAGNRAARRLLIEIAWRAQLQLCARYRRLARTGKPTNVVTAAIARELAGFVSAIARQVTMPAG